MPSSDTILRLILGIPTILLTIFLIWFTLTDGGNPPTERSI